MVEIDVGGKKILTYTVIQSSFSDEALVRKKINLGCLVIETLMLCINFVESWWVLFGCNICSNWSDGIFLSSKNIVSTTNTTKKFWLKETLEGSHKSCLQQNKWRKTWRKNVRKKQAVFLDRYCVLSLSFNSLFHESNITIQKWKF